MKTVRLTVAQALIKFLDNQYIEFDGKVTKFVEGIFGIFGHGNVLGIGQALEQDSGNLIVRQGRNEQGMAEVAVKNKFLLGDEVEMMTPQGNIVFKIEKMLNRKNENVEAALGDGHFVFLDVPQDVQLDYALLMRNLVNTNTRNPHN